MFNLSPECLCVTLTAPWSITYLVVTGYNFYRLALFQLL